MPARIAALQMGDELEIVRRDNGWMVLDRDGAVLTTLTFGPGQIAPESRSATLRITKLCLEGNAVIDAGGHVVPD